MVANDLWPVAASLTMEEIDLGPVVGLVCVVASDLWPAATSLTMEEIDLGPVAALVCMVASDLWLVADFLLRMSTQKTINARRNIAACEAQRQLHELILITTVVGHKAQQRQPHEHQQCQDYSNVLFQPVGLFQNRLSSML